MKRSMIFNAFSLISFELQMNSKEKNMTQSFFVCVTIGRVMYLSKSCNNYIMRFRNLETFRDNGNF